MSAGWGNTKHTENVNAQWRMWRMWIYISVGSVMYLLLRYIG